MRRSFMVSVVIALGLAALETSPGAKAAYPRPFALLSMDKSDRESNENYFLFYASEGSESDCCSDTSCDIVATAFAISRELTDEILVVVSMAVSTDPELSNNDTGGISLYIDSDGDPDDWDYLAITRYRSYGLNELESSTLQEWDGEEWQWSDYAVEFLQSAHYWGIVVPLREIGIETASFAVRA